MAGFVDRISSPLGHLYYSGSIKERRTGLFDLNPDELTHYHAHQFKFQFAVSAADGLLLDQ